MSTSSNEQVPGVNDLLTEFSLLPDEDELDLSSLDLYDFPQELFTVNIDQLKILTFDHNALETLSDNIHQLTQLTQLSLVGNNIIELPETFGNLIHLEVVVLNENDLTTLPTGFGSLESLTSLSIIGNKLICLPESFTNLNVLEELYLDENNISSLPTDWSELKSLSVFEISNNQLTSLPPDFGDLKQLTVLSCNYNLLDVLPENFSNLNCLEILDFSNNKLTSLPDRFDSACVIEKLYLENNGINFLPAWFSELSSLIELTLSENQLVTTAYSDGFCKNATKLKKFETGANFIETLPENFGNLINLEYIHFGSTIHELERSNFQNGNWIKRLPDSFCDLKNLRKANINENQIFKLPDNFGSLLQLTWLDLGQNMLEFLPKTFCCLINLEFIQLSKNQLKELPHDIGNLIKLVDLRLDTNLLTRIPDSVAELSNLRSLDLFHNELTEIPSVVYKLNKLNRLDLDQNCFALNMNEIPKITPGNNYPDRDPTLKDNWRGKTRPDKKRLTNVINIDLQNVNEKEDPPDEEQVQWNENALAMAIRRGMSMWRSHNAPSTRNADSPAMIIEEEKQKRCKVNDDDWQAVTYNILGAKTYLPGISSYRPKTKTDEINNTCEEDWDQEIDEKIQYNSILETCRERESLKSKAIDPFQNLINKYPPAKQAYSSTAGYHSFVYKQNMKTERINNATINSNGYIVVNGQFDDVD